MDSWRRPHVPRLPGRGQEPRLRDTATGELRPAAAGPPEGPASIYACGITPYDATHIGHANTFTAWDLLIRAWLDAGRPVTYIQNVTDVDDPLLERAVRDGEDWRELARRETQLYRGDMEALRVLPPAELIGAVEAIGVIDRFAARLADRGSLYDLDGDIYFARAADPGFGDLSGPGTPTGLDVGQMRELSAERGGDPDRPGKKDPLDVLVWRAERPGEPSWESQFGPGRPGWHVECAAIASDRLGQVFDVQAGGSDLVFPHHEMSASHTRVAHAGQPGHAFARVYAHAGMVGLDGEKMSKSLGNLVFVSRLVAGGEDPMAVRLALLAHHYRDDWEWTAAGLAAARTRLTHWRTATTAGASKTPPTSGSLTSSTTSGAPSVPAAPATSPASHSPAISTSTPASTAPAAPSTAAPSIATPSIATPSTGAPPAPATSFASAVTPAAEAVLAGVRERLANDLDAPGALAVIDRWADAALADPSALSPADRQLVRDLADALLGVAL